MEYVGGVLDEVVVAEVLAVVDVVLVVVDEVW